MSRSAYIDASAIVKLIHEEAESMALIDYLENPLRASTSVISCVEVARALRRSRAPIADIDEAMRGFFVVNLDAEVCEIAGQLRPYLVRAMDAIQLASAVAIGDTAIEFVTYDDRLAAAARENGLRVVQPGR